MMNTKFPAAIILMALLVSCSTQPKKSEGIIVLDLSQDITVESKMTLSQIATDINYTKLESNPECFIKRIENWSITDNYILIYDQSQPKILLFDRRGKFLMNISRQGSGPGEYNRLGDVRISGDGKYILLEDFNKVLRFGFDGKLIGETKLPAPARNIDTFGEGLIAFFTLSNSVVIDNYSVAFFDWDGNCKGKILKCDEALRKIRTGTRTPMFYAMNDEFRINGWYNDTVFAIMPDQTIVPRIVIMDPHGKEKRSMENMNFQLDIWMETPEYLFFYGAFNNFLHQMYLDKGTGLIYHVPLLKGIRSFGIPDDLDGGAPFWPSRYQNGYVYRFLDSEKLKSDLDNPLLDKAAFTKQALRDKLLAFKKNLSVEDGPVLIEVKLK